MSGRVISIILTCFHLLLVGGLDTNDTRRQLKDITPAEEERLWIVRMHVPVRNGTLLCAGSIITERWALTSALCVSVAVCEHIRIYPSTLLRGYRTIMRGELCVNHPKYNSSNQYFRLGYYEFYDIGLIKNSEYFDSYLNFAIKILPPEGTHNCPGELAKIFGWGIGADHVVQETLQKVLVKIESWKKCNEAFRECYNRWRSSGIDDAPSVIIPQTGFCTHGLGDRASRGCLYGVSGSPVTVNDVLVGVLSGPLGDESDGSCFPLTVHMNIADYLPWIYRIISPELDTSSMIVGIE